MFNNHVISINEFHCDLGATALPNDFLIYSSPSDNSKQNIYTRFFVAYLLQYNLSILFILTPLDFAHILRDDFSFKWEVKNVT